MAECWVVNASPLISLDRIGLLDILGRLGREVVIPRGVLDEVARGPAPITPGRLAIHRTVVISAIDPVAAGWALGRGESYRCLPGQHASDNHWPFSMRHRDQTGAA